MPTKVFLFIKSTQKENEGTATPGRIQNWIVYKQKNYCVRIELKKVCNGINRNLGIEDMDTVIADRLKKVLYPLKVFIQSRTLQNHTTQTNYAIEV